MEWSDGKELGTMAIECVGSTVVCACGYGIAEDGGTLREFRVPGIGSSSYEKQVISYFGN